MNAVLLQIVLLLLPAASGSPAAPDLVESPLRMAAAGDGAADVEAAREALDKHPWYNPETDGERLIDVRPSRQEAKWDFSWLSGITDWMDGFSWDFSFLGSHITITLWQVLVTLVAVLVLGIVIYYLVKVFHRRAMLAEDQQQSAARTRASDQDRVEALPFKLKRQATDLLGEARRAYQQGSFSEAVIYLFSYQLVEMDKCSVIHLAKGKTNRNYLREISPRRPLRELVENTMVAFEDVFFGHHQIDRERFESCWSRLDRFEQLIRQPVS